MATSRSRGKIARPGGQSSLGSGGPCGGSPTPGQGEARGRRESSRHPLRGGTARPAGRAAAPSSPRVPRRSDTAKRQPHFCGLGDAAFGSSALPGAKPARARGARLGWDPPSSPSLPDPRQAALSCCSGHRRDPRGSPANPPRRQPRRLPLLEDPQEPGNGASRGASLGVSRDTAATGSSHQWRFR